MFCAYIDDTGNTGDNLDDTSQPIHYVGALMVPEQRRRIVVEALDAVECKARKAGYMRHDLEFHGQRLYSGAKEWHGVGFGDRMTIYQDLVDIINNESLDLVIGTCDKPLLKRKGYRRPDHPHYIAFWLCLERI